MSSLARPVVTRFAPSPTGALHIGGARTALFAWAFARQAGGTFILRIEDTDQRRSSRDSAAGILRDLAWLGLDWDQGPDATVDPVGDAGGFDHQRGATGPYFQSQRLPFYQQHVDALKEAGLAYDDAGAVRLRMGVEVQHEDAVFGSIVVPGKDLEDFVIQKADGFPTFHLAVVVDDALMGVTHVLRGAEHLSNTPKHAALYDAFAALAAAGKLAGGAARYARPVWAHMPSILNPGGSKMSKRDKAKVARAAALAAGRSTVAGVAPAAFAAFMAKDNDDAAIAVAIAAELGLDLPEIEVLDFARSGYLPAAILNYISLLGWNPKTGEERYDLGAFVAQFNLAGINKSGSTFDRDKLLRFNAERVMALDEAAFAAGLRAVRALREDLAAFDTVLADERRFAIFCRAYQPRARTLLEPFQLGRWAVLPCDSVVWDFTDKAIKKALLAGDRGGEKALTDFAARMATLPDQDFGQALHGAMEAWCAATGAGMGKLAAPLRIAFTGGTVSPGMADTADLLGKAACLRRVQRLLSASAHIEA